jgi:threonylcarbamoyladenosine tRNA methylthiotransferase MtaB
MTSFGVDHLGCKISLTDAQSIEAALVEAGHASAADGDIRVVNTCCITGEAERKSRKQVRRAANATSDAGRVFVTGCGASNDPAQYERIDARVTVLPGAASLAAGAIVAAADALAGLGCRGPAPGRAPGHEPAARRSPERTRAFIKVQDGCDFHCSYCIVPAVRGEPRSRSLDVVVEDVRRRVERGQVEMVLTGVNIGLFRDERSRVGLDQLLLAVADVDGVERVRISSIESNHVSRRLVAAMASHPKVCPHLHVPLQSGDDAVLARMGRHYDVRRYLRAIEAARTELPGLNLTTDVIVGHPGEDDASVERTLQLVADVGFTKVHAFPFSARPGTVAAQDEQIDAATKSDRARRLRAQGDRNALAFRAARVGTADEVLVETRAVAGYGAGAGVLLTDDHIATDTDERSSGRAPIRTGYTRDYSPIVFANLPDGVPNGAIVPVQLIALDDASGVLTARVRWPAGRSGP